MDRQFIILFVIGTYMLAMIIVGLYYSRSNNTVSDYVLGGRSLNPWVTACLLYTSKHCRNARHYYRKRLESF